MSDRQSGITTKQMLNAPKGSVFIWPNSRLSYPLHLAKHLGRHDLIIRSISFLDFRYVVGYRPAGVVIDHACCELSRDNMDALDFLKKRVFQDKQEAE